MTDEARPTGESVGTSPCHNATIVDDPIGRRYCLACGVTMSQALLNIAEERDRYKAALERILAKRRSEENFWHQDRHFPTDASKNWHDGHVTAMATISLLCYEALDPVAWEEHQEQWRLASHGNDREWFERTGMCGHCGNPGDECLCTPDDPCGCGPHELRTDTIPCLRCKGSGEILPPGARRG